MVQIETYSFSIYCSSNLMFDVWLVNQKVSFLWRCWCESYQSFIDYILSRKLFTNPSTRSTSFCEQLSTENTHGRLLVLVEHGLLFYVSSAVNFEEFPTDSEDVKDKDDQACHTEDLSQAEKIREDQNTGRTYH